MTPNAMTPPPDNSQLSKPRRSKLAMASLVLGAWVPILLVLLGFLQGVAEPEAVAGAIGHVIVYGAFVSFPASIIIGIVALCIIRSHQGQLLGRGLAIGGICLSGLIVSVALCVYPRVNQLLIEDAIHDAYFPVVAALCKYEDDHHSPATNLSQLVTAYIPDIPRSQYADSVEYSVIDNGRGWQFCIHSRALSTPRIYCCRQPWRFTEEEKRQILSSFHVWAVLKEGSLKK